MAVCIEIGQMSLIREENQYKTPLALFIQNPVGTL